MYAVVGGKSGRFRSRHRPGNPSKAPPRFSHPESLQMPRKDRKRPHQRTYETAPLSLAALNENAILRNTSGDRAASLRIVRTSELVTMPVRHAVYDADEEITHVYFPIDCVLSVVTHLQDGSAIEIGTIGREGTSGLPLLMGSETSANDCYCQVPGDAIKMPVKEFRHLLTFSKFRRLLDRYLQAYLNFLGQLTACNRLHSVYERTARWLLLSHDRVKRDDIVLTQEYLAMMLGSRRSGVTIALSALQRAGYLRSDHGTIIIQDRAGLEATTCECYGVAKRQFSTLLSSGDAAK